jgi:cbb3-type cytochrome oxidase subunit 3
MLDVTTLREIATVVSFVCFIGILLWVVDPAKSESFKAAARLPFLNE